MQNRLEELKSDFIGKEFIYQEAPHLAKKSHKGIDVSIVGDKFKIETDTRTFVVHNSELNNFIEKVIFSGDLVVIEKKEVKPLVKKNEVFIPEACNNLSDGLMAMFNKISSGTASKNDFEQAKSMSDIAGKIIDVEKVKLGYLALSKR